MNTFPFTDRTATDVDDWFNVKQESGLLANYLLDPQEFFVDGVTSRLTQTLVKCVLKYLYFVCQFNRYMCKKVYLRKQSHIKIQSGASALLEYDAL